MGAWWDYRISRRSNGRPSLTTKLTSYTFRDKIYIFVGQKFRFRIFTGINSLLFIFLGNMMFMMIFNIMLFITVPELNEAEIDPEFSWNKYDIWNNAYKTNSNTLLTSKLHFCMLKFQNIFHWMFQSNAWRFKEGSTFLSCGESATRFWPEPDEILKSYNNTNRSSWLLSIPALSH